MYLTNVMYKIRVKSRMWTRNKNKNNFIFDLTCLFGYKNMS
jgi:hypothetical protein